MVQKNEKRGSGRPRKFDPNEVLDKVIDVFWELGYDAADTETLSQRTGLTKPSLYNAFGSKEDMFVAALNRYRMTRSEGSRAALSKASAAADGLRNYFVNLALNIAAPGRPRGCLLISIALPLKERLPKVAAALQTPPKGSAVGFPEYFEAQKQKGNLPHSFNGAAALSLIQDLGASMIVEARGGASLETLKTKAKRNAELVLYMGNAQATE